MRKYGITREDVAEFLDGRAPNDFDPDGRLRFVGEIQGIRVRIVEAIDRPGYIVTLHERKS